MGSSHPRVIPQNVACHAHQSERTTAPQRKKMQQRTPPATRYLRTGTHVRGLAADASCMIVPLRMGLMTGATIGSGAAAAAAAAAGAADGADAAAPDCAAGLDESPCPKRGGKEENGAACEPARASEDDGRDDIPNGEPVVSRPKPFIVSGVGMAEGALKIISLSYCPAFSPLVSSPADPASSQPPCSPSNSEWAVEAACSPPIPPTPPPPTLALDCP